MVDPKGRDGSESVAPVTRCCDRYTSNTGLECGPPWRPFRAKTCRKQVQQLTRLFDHIVGEQLHRIGHVYTEGLRDIQIDDKLERVWLLDRDISRLCSAQNLVDNFCGTAA